MNFEYLIEYPLLWTAFFIFIFGIITRLAFFFTGIIKGDKKEHFRHGYYLFTLTRISLPYYKAFTKKPFFVILCYFFHFCMIIVPIWFSGHIVLWEESRFEWYWDAMSDQWADWLTLLFLGIAAFLFMRRLISAKTRLDSSISDYFLIIVTTLPFMTGYFLTHGSLDYFISFHTMWTIHVFCGEIMLVLIVFLFCRTRINGKGCTGCAACELNCPTGALSSTDEGKFRNFIYSHYLCIWCGACARVCPEEAVELRHEIGVIKLFHIFSRDKIRSVKLATCKGCGANFAPIPQLDMIAQKMSEDYLFLCLPCRKLNISAALYNLDFLNKHPVCK